MCHPPMKVSTRIPLLDFRPQLWPTLFTVPALAVLIGIGTWQVQRLHWKQDLIALRSARLQAPPVALSELDLAGAKDLAALEFRRVQVTGRFLHEEEMYLAARNLRSSVGYHVITPLERSDGSVVLVNRGWVPLDRKAPGTRAAGQRSGSVTVSGLLRAGGRKGVFTPDNRPGENFWFYVDVPAMAVHAGLERVHPFVIEAGPAANPGGFPIGGQSRVKLRNDHLQYAITWYSLAAALLVIYVLYHRRERE